jgi:hypothetical protein
MYKLKTQTLVDRKKSSTDSNDLEPASPPAFLKISALCMVDDYLAVAGASGHVTLYKYAIKNNCNSNPVDDEMADIPVDIIQTHNALTRIPFFCCYNGCGTKL